jgi:hypothetical protein
MPDCARFRRAEEFGKSSRISFDTKGIFKIRYIKADEAEINRFQKNMAKTGQKIAPAC